MKKLFLLSLCMVVSASAETISYTFKSNELQGWTVVQGASEFKNGGIAAKAEKGEDHPHPTLLVRSPMFRLDDSGDLVVGLLSGKGGGLPESARLLPVDSVKNGPMGFALRRVTDDAYVVVGQLSTNAAKESVTFNRNQLKPLLESAHDEVYTLDFFDGCHGGWGHAEMTSVRIPGKLIEPLKNVPAGFENARLIFLGATHGRLAFDKTRIYVLPGSKLAWTMFNSDEMAHNWVLCQPSPTVANEIGKYVVENLQETTPLDYIPKDPRIIKHSTLVAPGTSDTQYFTAPTKEGVYPYVCTFPGHHITMRGKLYVVNKLRIPKTKTVKPMRPKDPYQLVVGDRPIVQRGPLNGGGSAVVCVGTPEGVHFAFDTMRCKITHIWTSDDGAFLGMKNAWGGRGGKSVEPRGAMKFKAAKGEESGRRFRSYAMNETGIPSFHFTDNGIETSLTVQVSEKALMASYSRKTSNETDWVLDAHQSIGDANKVGESVKVSGSFQVNFNLSN